MIGDGRSHDSPATDHDASLAGQGCVLGLRSRAEKLDRAPQDVADGWGPTAPRAWEEPREHGWGQSLKAPHIATHCSYTCNKTTCVTNIWDAPQHQRQVRIVPPSPTTPTTCPLTFLLQPPLPVPKPSSLTTRKDVKWQVEVGLGVIPVSPWRHSKNLQHYRNRTCRGDHRKDPNVKVETAHEQNFPSSRQYVSFTGFLHELKQ